jgi:hypothetical protein
VGVNPPDWPGGWVPGTEAETGMAQAVATRDQLAFLAALSRGALLLPLLEPVRVEQDLVRWPTVVVDGTRYVVAFTSRAAMPPSARGDVVRVSPLFDVVEGLAGHGYGLAVDLGLPIQVFLSPAALSDLGGYEALWTPREAALRTAVRTDDAPGYLAALVDGSVVLPLPLPGDGEAPRPVATGEYWTAVHRTDPEFAPFTRDITDPAFPWWRTERADGRPVVLGFTTPVRMQAEVGERDWIEVPFLDVVSAWPDADCALRLNSGGATTLELAGAALTDLRESYAKALRDQGF